MKVVLFFLVLFLQVTPVEGQIWETFPSTNVQEQEQEQEDSKVIYVHDKEEIRVREDKQQNTRQKERKDEDVTDVDKSADFDDFEDIEDGADFLDFEYIDNYEKDEEENMKPFEAVQQVFFLLLMFSDVSQPINVSTYQQMIFSE